MSTKFLSPGWRMPRNANQSKSANYSLNFDSSSSQDISFTTPAPFNGATLNNFDCSFSVWANFNSVNQFGALICFGQFDLEIAPVTSTQVGIWIDNSALAGVLHTPSLNIWYHYVMTKSGNTYSLYVDGVLIGSGTDSDNATVGSPSFIGSNGGFGAGRAYFDGKLNGAAIFDYALSQGQVTTLWGGGTSVSNPMALPSPPVAYYPLGTSAWNGNFLAENNAIGDYVFDFSGNKTVGLSQNLNLGSQSTISYWVKSTSNIGNYILNNGGNLINTGPYSTNEYYTFKPNNSAPAPNSAGMTNSNINTYILSTNWVHWTVVRNGTGCELYANGQSIATATQANWSGYDTIVSGLGKNASGIVGDASNFLFWNTNLSATEVETLYNYGSPIQTLANIPQSSNLKAWYKLDASEIYNSSITDWEINEATADYTSSLSVKAVNGSGNQVPNIQTWGPTSAITFAGWFKINTSNADWDYLMVAPSSAGSGSPSFYFVVISGKIYSVIKTDGNSNVSIQSTNSGYNDGKWHHIARTWDGSVSNLYIDGQNASTDQDKSTTGSINYGTVSGENNLGIGTSFVTARTLSFLGEVSNVSIWNKGLSTAEITELYNNGQPGNLSSHSAISNLTGWWTLKDASTAAGGGLVDLSSNSNNANTANTDIVPGSVSTLNGLSSGMSQSNLVQSDLQTVAPYSKYAMNFDRPSSQYTSVGTVNLSSSWSVSIWVAWTDTISQRVALNGSNGLLQYTPQTSSSGGLMMYPDDTTNNYFNVTPAINDGNWHNVVFSYDNSTTTLNTYTDGYLSDSRVNTAGTTNIQFVGGNVVGWYWNGKLSNCSVWDTNLSAIQVREIYNEGLPSNLNNHSAYSNLTNWWQLGENSSFNGNDWIVADEKGSNNGTSAGMGVDALTNGVGTTANGTSTGMAVGALVGDAPYSTANAVSSGMAVTARETDVPPTP